VPKKWAVTQENARYRTLPKRSLFFLSAFWWYYLKYDPNLESLHDEPEYQAIVDEIETDMAAQLARVREMERNGELEPIPKVSATTQ
jgi:hypothetical protein